MGADIRDLQQISGNEFFRIMEINRERAWFQPDEKKRDYFTHDFLRRKYRTQFIADVRAGRK